MEPDLAKVAKEQEERLVQQILDLKVEAAFRQLLKRVTPFFGMLVVIALWFGYDLKTTGAEARKKAVESVERVDKLLEETKKKAEELERTNRDLTADLDAMKKIKDDVTETFGEIKGRAHSVREDASGVRKDAAATNLAASLTSDHAAAARQKAEEIASRHSTVEKQTDAVLKQAAQVQKNDLAITALLQQQERITSTQRRLLPFLYSDIIAMRSKTSVTITLPNIARGGSFKVTFHTPDIEKGDFTVIYDVDKARRQFNPVSGGRFPLLATDGQYDIEVDLIQSMENASDFMLMKIKPTETMLELLQKAETPQPSAP